MKSFNEIMSAMLENVPNELDKREGSVIYTALAPCAMELHKMYIDIETCLNLAYSSTSKGQFLDMRVNEFGIERMPCTKSIRKAIFKDNEDKPFNVNLSDRFSIDGLNYTVINKIDDGIFKLECETSGDIGNSPIGNLLPITYINGLAKAIISDILVAGTDEETDENLLKRYHLKVREPTTSGNIYNYKQWALEISGVGDAKVFPLWNGNGTVKVVIIDTNKSPVVQDTIDRVTLHIEQMRPIGATVTVVSGISKNINISARLILQNSMTIETVTPNIVENISKYFKDISFKRDFISFAQIGLIILSTEGVLDYSNLTLNADAFNIKVAENEIPKLGETDFMEVGND